MIGLLFLVGGFFIYTASAQAHKYPAGLDPALCPNYPHCDNAYLALHQEHHVGAHMGAAPHSGGYFRPYPSFPNHYLPQAAPGYPVGLSPAACPNYPYCSHHIPQHVSHYGHGHGYAKSYATGATSYQ